ncbi:hypothetical protein EMIHUDRAFT_456791 [Emiliania huxleyi CCMP1516]|uniref:Uncharacterized protein n=2 Tax=Emiliania huxleyi TaxID=2903 RepID=A0A0D3K199_EMIH1|nr:hypothetical protein EMIHUDRAFT_456791 [Emiliania huxleyi CCMP1516]EOD29534.1 hypothetical protein EMIHUDRAFT_456791 [Emiliania huxleyi CCMP1516]|eukprot:XP_005781963.1 hypothetical protein EMIHUDRAFT_456791 [Emiliania huxleyi CCMP1516]
MAAPAAGRCKLPPPPHQRYWPRLAATRRLGRGAIGGAAERHASSFEQHQCIAFAGTAALLLQRDQAFNHWGRPKRSPSKVSLCTFRCLPSETPNISPAEWEAAKAAEQRRAGLEHNRAQTKGDSWGGGVSFLDSGPLECGRYDADDCKAAYRSGKDRGTLSNFYARCRSEHGSQPLRSRCTLCCTGENARWAHAVKASADSNFGTRGKWDVRMATGAPTLPGGCRAGKPGSWAPRHKDLSAHKLRARATRITIYEHANPPSAAGFVRSVTLVAPSGATHVVWSGVDMTGCGGALTVPLDGSFVASAAIIATRTSQHAWEYVDAVRLDGWAAGGQCFGSRRH